MVAIIPSAARNVPMAALGILGNYGAMESVSGEMAIALQKVNTKVGERFIIFILVGKKIRN